MKAILGCNNLFHVSAATETPPSSKAANIKDSKKYTTDHLIEETQVCHATVCKGKKCARNLTLCIRRFSNPY